MYLPEPFVEADRDKMPKFVKGLELSRAFYWSAVQPILARRFPDLPYSAGLIGSGSEVLGYDDVVSTDHHWGPRLLLFLRPADYGEFAEPIKATLGEELPYHFMGYPTNFSSPRTAADDMGTQILQSVSSGPVNHRVEVYTLDGFMRSYLGIGEKHELTAPDWLSIAQQRLLGFVSGQIFHDGLDIGSVRERFDYYPHEVWLYLLACAWSRIGQDEHLAPRAGAVGDELGSALIAGRLVRSIMQLCFLMEKRYAPYAKWFGRAFAELECAAEISPILRAIQAGDTFRERERHLCAACSSLNAMHNNLNLTEAIAPAVAEFHGRGFMVSQAWRYSEALQTAISDDEVKAIAAHSLIGSIDQFSDNTDMRESVRLRARVARLYAS